MSEQLDNILNFISAASGLGVAAMGLVDASKAFWGGPSNFGFSHVRMAIKDFLPPADAAVPLGRQKILATLKSNWINGVAVADQKAAAKSLIHLGLTAATAAALAGAANVDPTMLATVAGNAVEGNPQATPAQLAVLGQFDAALSAVLDDAYERGDQIYRNACKALATFVSAVLGVCGGIIMYGWADFHPQQFFTSLAIGLIATPLAPVAKDLATSLQAAAKAVGAVKG